MHRLTTRSSSDLRQSECHRKTHNGIHRKADAAPLAAFREPPGARIIRAEYVPRGHQAEEHPHAEQTKPSEYLNHRELFHRRRHLGHRRRDLPKCIADPSSLGLLSAKLFQIVWRILS